MSKLVIVRHGQSEWNKANIFTGWVDVDRSCNPDLLNGLSIWSVPPIPSITFLTLRRFVEFGLKSST